MLFIKGGLRLCYALMLEAYSVYRWWVDVDPKYSKFEDLTTSFVIFILLYQCDIISWIKIVIIIDSQQSKLVTDS